MTWFYCYAHRLCKVTFGTVLAVSKYVGARLSALAALRHRPVIVNALYSVSDALYHDKPTIGAATSGPTYRVLRVILALSAYDTSRSLLLLASLRRHLSITRVHRRLHYAARRAFQLLKATPSGSECFGVHHYDCQPFRGHCSGHACLSGCPTLV